MKNIKMKTRNEVIEDQKAKYRLATKKVKSQILNSLVVSTGLSRDRLARKLKDTNKKTIRVKHNSGRKVIYDDSIVRELKRLWELLDYPCGKRMAAAMSPLLDALERHHSMSFQAEILIKLRTMSASTIDRLLFRVKQGLTLKGRSTTKPGTLLRQNIPLRLGTQWDDAKPGFTEIDLVAHCGASAVGEYVNTLDVTDIVTGWTETRAVVNKAQKHVFDALLYIKQQLPFPLLGIDSDNGAEFINNQLFRYCKTENILFTRGRSYQKNDNCHVEQKNWSIVRRNIGYSRYEGWASVDILNAYYDNLRLFSNYFLPQAKLLHKHTIDNKTFKKYEIPLSPYQRILNSSEFSCIKKKELELVFLSLDPVELKTHA